VSHTEGTEIKTGFNKFGVQRYHSGSIKVDGRIILERIAKK